MHVAKTAPVLSTHPPNQDPATSLEKSNALDIIGRIIMQGIVSNELMRIASFWSFSLPFKEFLIAVAAEDPQMTVQPVKIIDCFGRSLNNFTPRILNTTKRIGVSIQAMNNEFHMIVLSFWKFNTNRTKDVAMYSSVYLESSRQCSRSLFNLFTI